MELYLKIIIAVFVTIFGLCIGSFLNVIIYRCPRKLSIVKPGSFCPKCKEPIKFYDNIPIISYIILGGKCRHCKEKISFRYPLVEGLTGLSYLASFLMFGLDLYTIFACLIATILIVISFIDLDLMIIPDTCVLILLGLAIILFFIPSNYKIDWLDKIIGLGVVSVLYLTFSIASKIRKKDLIGFGDIKLLAAMSLILGWESILLGLFVASLVALVYEVIINKNRTKKFPFAPFLSIGFMFALYFGPKLVAWYIGLIR